MVDEASSVRSIVKALGGREVVGDACGVGYTAVSNWIAWNRFPERAHRPLTRLCSEKSVTLPDQLFDKEQVDRTEVA